MRKGSITAAALAVTAICLFVPIDAGAAKPLSPAEQALTGADTDVNELLFGEAGSGYFLASERQFKVTPATRFFGKSGVPITLSSIRPGSSVEVVFHVEADGKTLTALTVTITKNP